MKPVLRIFVLVAVACLMLSGQNALARSGRKCPECAKHRRRARKGHSQRDNRNNAESKGPSFALPQSFDLASETLQASDTLTLKPLGLAITPLSSGKNLGVHMPVKKYPTNHYTEAIVETTIERTEEVLTAPRVVGKFGYHSRHQNVRGRLVHVRDSGRDGSHFGCSGDIDGRKSVAARSEPWVALISRGKCTFLVKIKLAEKLNASAVIVYDTGPSGAVEVMRTIGSRIPSLMVSATDGRILTDLADGAFPAFVNISVGVINIQTNIGEPLAQTDDGTEAIVDFQSRRSESRHLSLHKTIGMFGTHSPKRTVSAKVIHVTDPDREGWHYGCSGRISNEQDVREIDEEWIALIAKGKCSSLAKIMLAERYGASAVVIYENKLRDDNKPINAVGANITVLTIDMNDGRKVLGLVKDGVELYLDIGVQPSPRTEESGRGRASTVLCSIYAVHFSLVISLIFRLV